MTQPCGPSVAVLVPAYNAAGTLTPTLLSIRAQSYRNLEIIVVDDGSTDDTRAIALRHASEDSRIKVVTQANAGVAAARMSALREAKSALVSPVDADDLWHENKIAKQVECLLASDPSVGLVYCWSAMIDAQGRWVGHNFRAVAEGDVLEELCHGNFLSNASCTLMRRAAIEQAGGYDSSLRSMGAQGCEDWLLYLRIAKRWKFGLVPELLTGYRVVPSNMSADTLTMWLSHKAVTAKLMADWPENAAELERSHGLALRWLIQRSIVDGRPLSALRLLAEAVRTSPFDAPRFLGVAAASVSDTLLRMLWLTLPVDQRARIKGLLGRATHGDSPRPGQPYAVGRVEGSDVDTHASAEVVLPDRAAAAGASGLTNADPTGGLDRAARGPP
jgi:glycosyltransferase involved in cell wall biosynthesis